MPMTKMESIQRIARDDYMGRNTGNYEVWFVPIRVVSEYPMVSIPPPSSAGPSRRASDDFNINPRERFDERRYRNSSHKHRNQYPKF